MGSGVGVGVSAGVAVGDPVAVFLESELVGAGAVSGIEEAVPLATLEFVEWSLPERWLAKGRTYYWRVRAVDAWGAWSDWSKVWTFTVGK